MDTIKNKHHCKRVFYKNTCTVLILLVTIVALFTECAKDDTTKDTSPFDTITEKKIKKVATIAVDNVAYENYEYNVDGKLVKISSNSRFTTYSYSKNMITQTLFIIGTDTITWELTLNSNGYVSKSKSIPYDNNQTTFEYDSEGHCIKKIEFSLGETSTETYAYLEGNVKSTTYTTKWGSKMHNYEYYLDKENTLSNEHYGRDFLGKSNKNLLKKSTISSSDIVTQTYEYDQDNYVIKLIQNRSGEKTKLYTYSYK